MKYRTTIIFHTERVHPGGHRTLPSLPPVDLDCKITIIGGGPSGAYIAMRLGKQFGSSICLFDKEGKVGGRLNDIKADPASRNSPLIAIGGRRVLRSQKVMFDLANELNLTLQKPHDAEQFLFARGLYAFNKNEFIGRYPGLPVDSRKLEEEDAETQLLNRLFYDPERKNIESHPNLKSYIESVIGSVGFQFLHDMTRFKADFEYPINAKSYIDWLEEEFEYDYNPHYPVNGMSSYVRQMVKKAREFGVRIFLSEPMYSINKNTNSGYDLSSSKRNTHSQKIIIAVPPADLPNIKGNIVSSITSQQPFQSLQGIRVITVTQWFDKV